MPAEIAATAVHPAGDAASFVTVPSSSTTATTPSGEPRILGTRMSGRQGASPRYDGGPRGLIERAQRLVAPGERRILGITGAPGSGKSTLASTLIAALAPQAVRVPMDGFHLANEQLVRWSCTRDAVGRPC
jgi:ABC-type protease/lipase transport system fused ATPase/permease subunit